MSRKTVAVPTPVSEPYWEALARHELTVQRCGNCGLRNFYPHLSCGAQEFEWVGCTDSRLVEPSGRRH
jgi:hypothetical protein